MSEHGQQFVAKSIAGQEKFLALAEREKAVTGVAVVVTFVIVAIAIVWSPSIWIPAVTGFGFGWFATRHLRARRYIRTTTSAIARLRGLMREMKP